ncbi:MAG: hypothetical protein Q8R39_01155 [bacterium]|nr:hypothetical protein [bacterium]MDZ4284221.1 hypothetical protein [Patescibacteria group bacterium]
MPEHPDELPPRLSPKAWDMLRAIYRSYETEDELLADPDNRIEELLLCIIDNARDQFSGLEPSLDSACKKGAISYWKRERAKRFEELLNRKPLGYRDFRDPVRIEYGLQLHRGGYKVFKR